MTSNSAKSGRPQPGSAGHPRHPGWMASKSPTNWQMEVIPFGLCPCSFPLHPAHPVIPPCLSGRPHLPAHCVFPGEPQSVQVDGRTQKLEGLIPGAQYEVTVVSVRGFEESEPLTGFLTTGERD